MPKVGQQTVNENLFFNKLTYVKLKYFVQPVSSLGAGGGGEEILTNTTMAFIIL